jgi:SAM-dependent methyltransferase
MFGKIIDYHILRPFTHTYNKRSEEELDEIARNTTFSLEEAHNYIERTRKLYFEGCLTIDPKLSYLDVGCGMGRLSIGLSLVGAKNITGVDILERNIEEANKIAEKLPNKVRPNFISADIHEWSTSQQFDIIIVLGAMEHIHHPDSFLKMLANLLKKNGRVFASFEPFQGPVGDHMSDFFWLPIPWRGLLFSEKAIMRLRNEKFRPNDPVDHYGEVKGGLNKMWYEDYIRYVHEAGLEFVKHTYNNELKYSSLHLPLYQITRVFTSIPKVRGFFIHSDYSILKHKK